MKLYKKIISVFLAGTLVVPDFMSCHATDFFACR